MEKEIPYYKPDADQRAIIIEWEPLGPNEEGKAYQVRNCQHLTFQVSALGSGGVEILGSIIPGKFDPMTDNYGVDLVFCVDGIKSSSNQVREIKPRLSGGSKGDRVLVAMFAMR